MLGCKNNRVDNLKKLARATAFRLAKEFQEKNRVIDSSKKLENKFTIKTSTKIERNRVSQKPAVVPDNKRARLASNTEGERGMPGRPEQQVKSTVAVKKKAEE